MAGTAVKGLGKRVALLVDLLRVVAGVDEVVAAARGNMLRCSRISVLRQFAASERRSGSEKLPLACLGVRTAGRVAHLGALGRGRDGLDFQVEVATHQSS